jgi:glycogen synthase
MKLLIQELIISCHPSLCKLFERHFNVDDANVEAECEGTDFYRVNNNRQKTLLEFMKVLMFGWEFPPHISGGLGTACFGLTQSLIKQKVKVLFVIPRVLGDDNRQNSFLISASEVKKSNGREPKTAVKKMSGIRTAGTSVNTSFISSRHGMTYIEVPAGLSPYGVPVGKQVVAASTRLRAWNHSMTSADPFPPDPTDHLPSSSGLPEDGTTDASYIFSGTYGTNLMEEVKRYAAVAGIIADKYSFDVIHVHDWMTFPAGITAKRRSKKPLVVHVHSTEFDRAGDHVNADVVDIEKRGLKEADQIVTVSNWTKEIVMSRYKIPESKIKVVHNGILPKEETEPFPFPEIGSHFVTFLGRVTHQKGPGYFVEAAQKVLQEFPDAHFIVAGAGDLLPQIIERVAQHNMSANFHFTGFLSGDQVDRIWSLTDVYVMPSVSEPFGIAPLEAIQGGVPVILSNQSGVSEVMPHAIKVDFWDIKALAAAICSVLRYESLSHVLRQHSKQHIQRLTWDNAAGHIKGLYHELIGKK